VMAKNNWICTGERRPGVENPPLAQRAVGRNRRKKRPRTVRPDPGWFPVRRVAIRRRGRVAEIIWWVASGKNRSRRGPRRPRAGNGGAGFCFQF